jgi:hypothetical protein
MQEVNYNWNSPIIWRKILTFLKCSHSWTRDSHWASREIHCVLLHKKIHYRGHTEQPLFASRGSWTQCTLSFQLFNITFHMFLYSFLSLHSPIPFRISKLELNIKFSSPTKRTNTVHTTCPSWFDRGNTVGEGHGLWNSTPHSPSYQQVVIYTHWAAVLERSFNHKLEEKIYSA